MNLNINNNANNIDSNHIIDNNNINNNIHSNNNNALNVRLENSPFLESNIAFDDLDLYNENLFEEPYDYFNFDEYNSFNRKKKIYKK